MDDLYDILMHTDFGEVLEVYEKVEDFSNTRDDKLLRLYNMQLEYAYGENRQVNHLDFAQMEWLKNVVEQIVLRRI